MKRTRTIWGGWLGTLLVSVVIVTTACGGSSGSGQPAGKPPAPSGNPPPAAVAIKDFKFDPPTLTVKTGTPVMVTNNDSQAHTFTSDTPGAFDQTLQAGTSAPVTVAQPGTYPYHCSFHPFMKGQLVVD